MAQAATKGLVAYKANFSNKHDRLFPVENTSADAVNNDKNFAEGRQSVGADALNHDFDRSPIRQLSCPIR